MFHRNVTKFTLRSNNCVKKTSVFFAIRDLSFVNGIATNCFDRKRKTISAASSFSLGKKNTEKTKKTEEAKAVGQKLALALSKKGVKKGVFDRGRYAYLGRVKALVTGLREGGLKI